MDSLITATDGFLLFHYEERILTNDEIFTDVVAMLTYKFSGYNLRCNDMLPSNDNKISTSNFRKME